MTRFKRILRQVLLVGIVLCAAVIMREASGGYEEMLKLRASHSTMQKRVVNAKEEKKYWEREKRRIEQDPTYVKQLARDFLNMIEGDEEAFILPLPDEKLPPETPFDGRASSVPNPFE